MSFYSPAVWSRFLKALDVKASWIQVDESKLLLRKSLFNAERGRDESLRQYTTRRLAVIEAASAAALDTNTVLKEGARLSKQSEQNLNTLLKGSTDLDKVARAHNVLDVDAQEGIIKAAVKPVVHSFVETGGSGGDQQGNVEEERTDEFSGEEESCLPLDEMMAASWIAQIGEEGLSEAEGMDSSVAMNEQRKRTWAQAQELKKAARKDRGFFSLRTAGRNRADSSRPPQQPPRQPPRQPSTSTDGDGTPKDLHALRRENRCFRCKKTGQWNAECQEKQPSKEGTAPAAFSGLTFLYTGGGVLLDRCRPGRSAWRRSPDFRSSGSMGSAGTNWRIGWHQVGAGVERRR